MALNLAFRSGVILCGRTYPVSSHRPYCRKYIGTTAFGIPARLHLKGRRLKNDHDSFVGCSHMRRSQLVSFLIAVTALVAVGCAGLTTGKTSGGNPPVMPSISAQPANQTVTPGQAATYSVTASGTAPLSYQW